jgi:hypothetical protein
VSFVGRCNFLTASNFDFLLLMLTPVADDGIVVVPRGARDRTVKMLWKTFKTFRDLVESPEVVMEPGRQNFMKRLRSRRKRRRSIGAKTRSRMLWIKSWRNGFVVPELQRAQFDADATRPKA